MANDFDKLLEAIGENYDYAHEFLSKLAWLRDPYRTIILSDLEREHGVLTDPNVSEEDRRNYLASIVYAGENDGTDTFLQGILRSAGFPVQVHINSPAVDPLLFGAGEGGEIISNSKIYDRSIAEASYNNSHWNYVFFIGGSATRDADDKITSIDRVLIDPDRKEQFRTLVLKYKPLGTWAIALINDTYWFTTATGDAGEYDTGKGYSNDDQDTGGFYYD